MQTTQTCRPGLASGLRTAVAALLLLAIVAAGTALIVRCIVELAETPVELFGNGR